MVNDRSKKFAVPKELRSSASQMCRECRYTMVSSFSLFFFTFVGILLLWPSPVASFTFPQRIRSKYSFSVWATSNAETTGTTSIHSFEFDGWTVAYQYKPPSKGFESRPPTLLIHPVGIGLSSWFWNRFMETWEGPALVAMDLIGCGIQHGGDAWDPDQRGMSIPLTWVKAGEALMQQQIASASQSSKRDDAPPGGYSVVVQGGLAPIGILLAARNPTMVQTLVLTSPPQWEKVTTAVLERELGQNYHFLRSPLGGLALSCIETRTAIQWFSNLFLFENPCDDMWLDEALTEACQQARPPVQAFNAGFLFHRSYQAELVSLPQPTLILQGSLDTARIPKRLDYAQYMVDCTLQTLQGKNVLPWEQARETTKAIQRFYRVKGIP